jgi:spore maturation protein CgeB
MKYLIAHPGASWSTQDVYDGLVAALKAQGHDLIHYRLDHRIGIAGSWLKKMLKKSSHKSPTSADILYQACQGILEKALRHETDMVLVISGMYFHPDFFVLLKRASLRVGVLFTESPYDDERQERILPHVDIAWTNERTSVDLFRKINPNTYYLPHAYNDEKHRPDDNDGPEVPSHDVVFVGTGFKERVELLRAVNWDGIDFGLYGHWSILGPRNKLRKHLKSAEIDNEITSALYHKAKIGINLHRTSKGFGRDAPQIDRAESLNPRAYELAACGCFYISDDRAEVYEIFNGSVPVFKSADELGFIIRHYLEHEEERKKAAARLPSVVRGHSWRDRAEQMMRDLAGTPAKYTTEV